MNNSTHESFLSFIKQLLVPISIFLYVATFLLQLKNSLEKLGVQIFSLALMIFVLLWNIYVWKTRDNKNGNTVFKYDKKIRYGAVLAFCLSLVPVIYIYDIQKTPHIQFEIDNQSAKEISVKYLNHYIIQKLTDNGFPYTVDNGLIEVNSFSTSQGNLKIEPKEKKRFYGVFLNENKVKDLFTHKEYFISLSIEFKEGGVVRSDKMLLLSMDILKSASLYLEVN